MTSSEPWGMRRVQMNGSGKGGVSHTTAVAAKKNQESKRPESEAETEPKPADTPANSTSAIVPAMPQQSMQPAGTEIQVLDSKPSSEILREAVLTTLSIADSSMSELLERSKGMFRNLPESDVRTYETDKVQTAALCGRTIAEIMKSKVEAMKLLKDNSEETVR